MEIGPLSNGLPMPEPDRPKKTAQETSPARQEISDRVEISTDARARLAELADRELKAGGARTEAGPTRSNQNTNDRQTRIDEIREKIESGFYDRPEVRDRIVDRLTDDLGF